MRIKYYLLGESLISKAVPVFDSGPGSDFVGLRQRCFFKVAWAVLIGLATMALVACEDSKRIPDIYHPHAALEDHPILKLATKLNPDHGYSIVDYPGLKAKYTQENIFKLVEKDLKERLKVDDDQITLVQKAFEQALVGKFPVTAVIKNRVGRPVRVLVIPEMEQDPRIVAANASLFDPQTLPADYKFPVSLEELVGAMRIHELAHMIDQSFKGRGEMGKVLERDGAYGAHRDEMFGDALSSLFVLRDFDGRKCVEFFQDLRVMRIFNRADIWFYWPSEKRTYTFEVEYLTWRASAEALRLHEEGRLKGKSDEDLRSLAADITKNAAYSVKELNSISGALRAARNAMGKTQIQVGQVPIGFSINPMDTLFGMFPTMMYKSLEVNRRNASETYSQDELFTQAIRKGHLKEEEPYVQRMKASHTRMLGAR